MKLQGIQSWDFVIIKDGAKEPLTGTVTYKNNTLPTGSIINIGFLMGHYDPETDIFSFATFTIDSTVYIWAVYGNDSVLLPGSSKSSDLQTYDIGAGAYDILVFLGPEQVLNGYQSDYGHGLRIIGIEQADLELYLKRVYCYKVYPDMIK